MLRLLACLLLLAPAVRADVPEIVNPGRASVQRTITYDEAWRVGADDTGDVIFGVIGDAVADSAGNVYLLDTQQQQVFKFGPDGGYLGLVSRRGEGPGEIRLVYGMLMLPDGRLGLMRVFPPALITVRTDGTPDGRIDLAPALEGVTGMASVFTVVPSGNGFVCSGRVHGSAPGSARPQTAYVVSLNADGTQDRVFYRGPASYDFNRPIVVDEVEDQDARSWWAASAGGTVYRGVSRDEAVLEILGRDGAPRRRIRFDRPPHRRSDAEREAAKNDYAFSGGAELPPISFHMANTDPAFSGLEVVGAELWIRFADLARALPDGIAERVEVCDLEGRLLEERSFALPYAPDRDRLIHLADGRLVRVKDYRAATAAAAAGLSIQHGESKEDRPVDGDAVLEVIVYRPRDAAGVAGDPDSH